MTPADFTTALLAQQARSRQSYADRTGLLASPLAASQLISFGVPVSNAGISPKDAASFSENMLGLLMNTGQYDAHLSENIYIPPPPRTSQPSAASTARSAEQSTGTRQDSSSYRTDPEVAISSPEAQGLKDRYGKNRPHLSNLFYNRVIEMAQRLGVDANDLMIVMARESGLKPWAVNPLGGATGLVQFMPFTARGLGTTTEQLKNMTAAEQLEYVEKCFKRVGVRSGDSASKIHARIFLPARADNPDGVLCRKGEGNNFYEHNVGLDRNKDGVITVDEC